MADIVPKTIAAGVNFIASAQLADYSGSEWTLRIMLRGPESIDLDATRDGAAHAWSLLAAETAAWTPGVYAYQVQARSVGGDAITIESGSRKIAPDFSAIEPGADVRSANRIALDAINAVLAKRATRDQERYRINNRELYHTPIADLLKLRAHYTELCSIEEAPPGSRRRFRQVKVRMTGGTA